MPGKNKSNNPRTRPDIDVSRVDKTKYHNKTNISNSNTGQINPGNTIHTGYNKQTSELHTKKSITGSDSDGQAE